MQLVNEKDREKGSREAQMRRQRSIEILRAHNVP